jgi:hypothetical protein
VAALEPDTEYGPCYPPHPAFARICEIYAVAAARNGADPRIGRRVAELFRRAALVDVGVETRTQMYPLANTRRTIRLDLVSSMRPQVLEMGLASETGVDELDAAARAHLGDPRTVAVSGLLFLAWGRGPAGASASFRARLRGSPPIPRSRLRPGGPAGSGGSGRR